MSVHSVHFLPVLDMPEPRMLDTAPPRPNVLQTYSNALQDAELVRGQLRGLIATSNRHGDLQVTLSALRRMETAIQILIAAEETS